MATKMANTDLTPLPGTSVHVHVPSGVSASSYNNPSDAPNATASAASPSGGKAVSVKIAQSNGGPRFSNPS